MTKEDLETALRSWGRTYGERPDIEPGEHDKAPAVHPIARAMEYAARGGDKRMVASYRRIVRPGERSWSRDAIACTETRTGHFVAPIAPPRASASEQVQVAWLALKRCDDILADVLRIEYQVRGLTQPERADKAGFKLGKYRELLAEAKGWMMGRLTFAIAA